MSYIERKKVGKKQGNFDGNTEGFSVRTSDSEIFGLLDSKMIGVADSSKFGELFGCKYGTSLGVSESSVEDITEGIMLGCIEVSFECSSIELFEWYSEGVKAQTLLGLNGNINYGIRVPRSAK